VTRMLIGVGNPDRGDDAAGWVVAGRVSTWSTTQSVYADLTLMDRWESDDEVVIVDAMRSGRRPGTTIRYDVLDEHLPSGAFTSTHAMGPAELVELTRALGRFPRTMTVIGIEIENTERGAAMSQPVAEAVSSLARELEHA
jgi:hydrogenase maturation protease